MIAFVKTSEPDQCLRQYRDLGYFVLEMTRSDLSMVREIVAANYTSLIREKSGKGSQLQVPAIENHHTITDRFDHGLLAELPLRLLPQSDVEAVRALSLFAQLQDLLGAIRFSGGASDYEDDLVWRVVRPDQPHDVGPWHADNWFWEIGLGPRCQPQNWAHRTKIWIPLFSQRGKNGLAIVPGTHKRELPYKTEMRDGRMKPLFTGDLSNERPIVFSGEAGNAIIFHGALLHRGMVNRGTQCRVSLEAEIYVLEDGRV